jgi:hypothetical protein
MLGALNWLVNLLAATAPLVVAVVVLPALTFVAFKVVFAEDNR